MIDSFMNQAEYAAIQTHTLVIEHRLLHDRVPHVGTCVTCRGIAVHWYGETNARCEPCTRTYSPPKKKQ